MATSASGADVQQDENGAKVIRALDATVNLNVEVKNYPKTEIKLDQQED